MKPPRVPPAALALLAMSLAASCRGPQTTPSTEASDRASAAPVRVVTAIVEERSLPDVLEVTGSLLADETADIAAERDGRVLEARMERGSYVERGAVIALLDPVEAKANLADAEATLAWTTSEKGRYEDLRQKGVISAAELQRKQLDVQSAEAKLELAQKGFADCVIRAPFSGLITERKISAGAFVKRGSPVVGLVKVDPLRAELAIPEVSVARVKIGQKVSLTVPTFPDRTFEGQIAYVGPSLKSESRTLVIEAVIRNPERLLRPGLFATAHIVLPASRLAALAPAEAVVTAAGVSRAFVLEGGKLNERVVSLGRAEGNLVEVRSGLKAGEAVVLKPGEKVKDGAPAVGEN